MSLLWLVFVSLAVIGALTYNIGVKFGGNSVSAFTFVLIASFTTFILQSLSFLIAKYGFKYDMSQGVNWQNVKYPIIAGGATALIDIAYYFALRYGSVVASQMFWTVGGTIAVTVVAIFFLNEVMTIQKAFGVLLGLTSVVLLIKKF